MDEVRSCSFVENFYCFYRQVTCDEDIDVTEMFIKSHLQDYAWIDIQSFPTSK